MDPVLRKGEKFRLELFGMSYFVIVDVSNDEIVDVYDTYDEAVKTFERLET